MLIRTLKNIVCITFILSFCSCANRYKLIKPSKYNYYNAQVINDKIEIAYFSDVYKISNNLGYSKKEKKTNYRAIAIRIKNLTDTSRVITPGNFRIFSNNKEILIEGKTEYFKIVNQYAARYLYHTLYGPWIFNTDNHKVSFIPIGLSIGVGNMLAAKAANVKHINDFKENEIFNRIIKPHETIYGLIILNNAEEYPLTFYYYDK